MANTGFKGLNVRQTGNQLVFRQLLQNGAALVVAGTKNLYLYEVQSDASLKSYDFNDNTFKTTALTTQVVAMTHQLGNNATTNTGVWTYTLSTLTGFTIGAIYLARVNNATATPIDNYTQFQYGSGEGDANFAKGAAVTNFQFLMLSSTDNKTPATGLAVAAQRSIDGAAAATCANAVFEVGNGVYRINLAASDLAGNNIAFIFTAVGANDNIIALSF